MRTSSLSTSTTHGLGELIAVVRECADAAASIDDPNAGWKGRSLWTTYSTRTMFHLEGGKENRPKVVRFQLRPDPLAR
jgi:hypothetical protein